MRGERRGRGAFLKMEGMSGGTDRRASIEHGSACPPALGIASPLGRADFDDMAAMEARFYGEDLITPAQEAWRWYERYPFTTLACREACGRIAGFVNLFPVREAVWEWLLRGAFNDADLTVDDVADPWETAGCAVPASSLAPAGWSGPAVFSGRPVSASLTIPAPALHMLLSCVVVDSPWQGSGLAYRLVARAAAQYADVFPRIHDVVIDTATPAGAKLARNLGFVPMCATDHATLVWRCSWQAFLRRLA